MKTFKTNRISLVFLSFMMFMAGTHFVEHKIEGIIMFIAFSVLVPIIIEDEEY